MGTHSREHVSDDKISLALSKKFETFLPETRACKTTFVLKKLNSYWSSYAREKTTHPRKYDAYLCRLNIVLKT